MQTAPFTDYDVKKLLRAKKFIRNKVRSNVNKQNTRWVEVIYRICRVDAPEQEIYLRFHARQTTPLLESLRRPLPSASLIWHDHRIRGIDRKITHADVRNGVPVREIEGWHEHQWNSRDGDATCIDVNDEIKRVPENFKSIVEFCLRRWRIEYTEYEETQGSLFEPPR
jgi:hypothetical protein